MHPRFKCSTQPVSPSYFASLTALVKMAANLFKDEPATLPTASSTSAAESLEQLGLRLLRQGKYQQALDAYRQVLVLHMAAGDWLAEANSLYQIGRLYSRLGDYRRSLVFLERSHGVVKLLRAHLQESSPAEFPLDASGTTWARSLPSVSEGRILSQIGAVYYQLGQPRAALAFCQQALMLLKTDQDRLGMGLALQTVGQLCLQLDRVQRGLQCFQKALGLLHRSGDLSAEAEVLHNIAETYHQLGQPQEALKFFRQALTVWVEAGDRPGEARTLASLGVVYADARNYAAALEHYQQALEVNGLTEDILSRAKIQNDMGAANQALAQFDLALSCYQQAFGIYRACGEVAEESRVLRRIQQIYAQKETLEPSHRPAAQ